MSSHHIVNTHNFAFPKAPMPGEHDYVSVFTNESGSTLVFVASPGVVEARVHHSELAYEAFPVVGGMADGILLDDTEFAFVAVCWNTSRDLRHDTGTSGAVVSHANEPRVMVQLTAVVEYATCAYCRERIGTGLTGQWYHTDGHGNLRERGCRAASWRATTAWDPALLKSWTATAL